MPDRALCVFIRSALGAILFTAKGGVAVDRVSCWPRRRLRFPQSSKNYQPVTAQRLLQPADGDWLMIRRSYNGWGYNPLAQINAKNIQRLQPAWIFFDQRNQWPQKRRPW